MKNVIVLFEVTPTKAGMQKYLDLAAMLKPMLSGFEGFIRAERFSSLNEEGKLLSMNVWTDEAAVERWRNVMQHRMSQKDAFNDSTCPHIGIRIQVSAHCAISSLSPFPSFPIRKAVPCL